MDIQKEIMDIAVEMVAVLKDMGTEDFEEMRLIMLAAVDKPRVEKFIQWVFFTAEKRRPLLIGMNE
ncbi:hypothetical protein [Catenibacillus scindens]|uniref:hypothetical protein n=1 Tax=Catenibacillus scindens TaxID=673271 RepID=UPI0032093D47